MRTKSLKRKLSNTLLLVALVAIILGIYYNIYNSKAEKKLEVIVTALDNYEYLKDEEFTLEATHIGNNMYEIELPKSINNKKVINIISATLESLEEGTNSIEQTEEEQLENALQPTNQESQNQDIKNQENQNQEENTNIKETNTTNQETVAKPTVEQEKPNESTKIEIINNKITISKTDLIDKKIKLEVIYDVALFEKGEDGRYRKILLSDKTEEERKALKITEETKIFYKKTLNYNAETETEPNQKTLELTGYLPQQAQLSIENVSQEKLKEVFGEAKIDVAYDIKILIPVEKQIIKEDGSIETIIEYEKVNPKDFGETCKVIVKDANILENAHVYHIKEDNTYETVPAKYNKETGMKFYAQNFSVYAVSSDKALAPTAIQPTEPVISIDGGKTWSTLGKNNVLESNAGEIDVLIKAKFANAIFWKIYTGIFDYGALGEETEEDSGIITYATVTTADGYTTFRETFNVDVEKTITFQAIGQDGTTWSTNAAYLQVIDSIMPEKPTITNSSGGNWTNSDVTLTVFAVNASKYQYSYNNSTWINMTGNKVVFSDAMNETVYIRGISETETIGSSNSTTVKIDKTAPTATGITLSSTYTKTGKLTATANEVIDTGGSGVKNVWWYVKDKSNTTVINKASSDEQWNKSIDVSTLSEWIYSVGIVVEDNAGNINDTTINTSPNYIGFVDFSYDKTAPYIEILGETNLVTNGLIRNYEAKNNTANGHSSTQKVWKDLTGNYYALINGATINDDYILFDGKDDWVNLGQIPNTNTITLETKIKINSIQQGQRNIIGNLKNGGIEIYLSGGKLGMSAYVDGNQQQIIYDKVLNINQIYNISGTYDGTNLRLYLDGELKAESEVLGTLGEPQNNTVMAIGANADGATAVGKFSNISVYLARIYERTLTQQEIKQNIEATAQQDKWTKSKNVSVRITDGSSGINTGADIQYGWSENQTTEPTVWKSATISNYIAGARSITFTAVESGITGKYYLWVKPKTLTDLSENVTTLAISTKTYWFDNKAPTITIKPTLSQTKQDGNSTWAKTHTETISIQDLQSKLAEGANLQYGWSTSNTEEPITWADAIIPSYTAEIESTSFTATGEGLTGKYYLWVKPIYLKDTIGNSQTETKVSTNTYYFDNLSPAITVNPTLAEACPSVDITITIADAGGSGFKSTNQYKYQLSRSNLEEPTGTWDTYVSGTKNTIGTNLSGEQYLWVKSISDNAGNTSTSNGTKVGEYHVYGPYIFDNILQSVIITGEATGTTNGLIRHYDGTNNLGNKHSKDTNTWKDLSENYNATINKITGQVFYDNHLALHNNGAYVDIGNIISPYVTLEASIMIINQQNTITTYIMQDNTKELALINGKLAFLFTTSSGRTTVTLDETLEEGRVYNISATYDGTSAKLYVDGALHVEKTISGAISNSTNKMTIGANTNNTKSNAHIDVYSARIYNRALLPAEIKQNLNADRVNVETATDEQVTISFIFEKDVVGFDLDDITVTNGTKGALTKKSNSEYTLEITEIQPNKNLTVSVAEGSYTDTDENLGSGASMTRFRDSAMPVATITTNVGDTTNLATITYNVKFNEAILGFAQDDIAVTKGTIDSITKVSNREYNVVVSNLETCNQVFTIRENAVFDVAGNGNIVTTKQTVVDINAPTIQINPEENTTWSKSHTVTVTIEDQGQGLAIGAKFQYAWSTSNIVEPTIWTTQTITGYTEGSKTASMTIAGSGFTGKYYLWVKPVTVRDTLGNVASATVIKSKQFTFDNTAPNITIGTGSNTEGNNWRKSHGIAVTIADEHSGISLGAGLQYGWSISNTEAPTLWEDVNIPSYEAGAQTVRFTATGSALTGKYYLWVKPTALKDTSVEDGNEQKETVISTGTYWFDNVAPTIEINPNENETWAKEHTLTVTIKDDNSGIALGASLQYGWSTQNTKAPTSWKDANIPSYEAGAQTASFTVTENTLTGRYYLWVKPVDLKDISLEGGNEQKETVISTGTYWFDNVAPTIEINPNENETWAKEHTATVTIKEVHSGLKIAREQEFHYSWSTSSEVEPTEWIKYEGANSLDKLDGIEWIRNTVTGSGLTGKYYLWIKPVKLSDGAGNRQTTIVKSTGTFWFDNTAPSKVSTITMKLDGEEGTTNYINNTWTNHSVYIALNNDAEDAHSGVKKTTYTVNGGAETSSPQTLTETGTYEIVVTTEDNVGLTSSQNYTIKIDKVAPIAPAETTLTMKLDRADGANYTNDTWTNHSVYIEKVDGTDEHSGHKSTVYSVKKDGVEIITNKEEATTLTETGIYTVTVTTMDKAGENYLEEGNITTNTYTIKIDKLKPIAPSDTVLITKLDNSEGLAYTKDTWTNHSVYIEKVDGTDEHSGHKSTVYSVKKDGVEIITNKEEATTLTETGIYTVTVTTMDKSGESYLEEGNITTNTYTIKIDKKAPTSGTMTMNLGNSSGPQYISGQHANHDVYISLNNGSDEHSGHLKTTYNVYSMGSNNSNETDISKGTLLHENQTDPILLQETGRYIIVVTTEDKSGEIYSEAGNKSTHTYIVIIDKDLPTITADPPETPENENTGNYVKTQNVTLTVSEIGVGLDEENEYQYCLVLEKETSQLFDETDITNAQLADETKWKTYLSGTPFEIGENKLTGTYYLIVKTIYDKAGNQSSNDTVIIGGVKYHQFGPYRFDNTGPIVEFNPTEDKTWKASHKITITVSDAQAELKKLTKIKYVWRKASQEAPTKDQITENVPIMLGEILATPSGWRRVSGRITKNTDSGNDWKVWVYVEDQLGNSTIASSDVFWLDNTKPTIEVNPTPTKTTDSNVWTSADVEIKITETYSGLDDNQNNYQYYLSTSPEALTSESAGSIYGVPQTLQNYTLEQTNETDVKKAVINIGSLETGTRYLFIKTVKDKTTDVPNESIEGGTIVTIDGVNYHRFGPYEFDNLAPNVHFNPYQNEPNDASYRKLQSTVVTLTEQGKADFNTETFKYLWIQSNTAPTLETFDTTFVDDTITHKGTYANNETITISGETGNDWYLWISAEDNLGNRLVQGTGPFWLDNIKPTIDVTSITPEAETGAITKIWKNADVTITVKEEHAKLIDNSIFYYLSTSANELKSVEEGSPYGEPQELKEVTLDETNSAIERHATISKLGWNSTDNSKTNETGQRYLFIKAKEDNAGNISNEFGTLVTIAEGPYAGTYHRFGPYEFDNAEPNITFDPDGSAIKAVDPETKEWKQSYNVQVTINEVGRAGIDINSLRYLWTENLNLQPEESEFTNTFRPEMRDMDMNTEETIGLFSHISTLQEKTGPNWILWILVKDKLGQTNIVGSKPFQLDNAKPVMQITTGDKPSINEVCKSTDVTISFNETHSGLAEETDYGLAEKANSYEYYLSTSSTQLENGKWFNYTKGETFTIGQDDGNGNPITGRRYLFVKTVKDKANNESNLSVSSNSNNTDDQTGQTISGTIDTQEINENLGTKVVINETEYHAFGELVTVDGVNYHRFGEFIFDNTGPEIKIEYKEGEHDVYQKKHIVGVDLRDSNDNPSTGEAGVGNYVIRYQWNQSPEIPTEESFTTAQYVGSYMLSQGGQEGGTVSTNQGMDVSSPAGVTGNNWYLWILAKDNVGNASIATTKGPKTFYLDNTAPTISINSSYPENQNIDVSGQVVTRYADITLTTLEQHSKLADTTNSYQYYLSTSNSAVTGGTWQNYTLTANSALDTRTATFRIGEGITGTRYLFVKTISDNAGNISTENGTLIPADSAESLQRGLIPVGPIEEETKTQYHLFGEYVFDNTAPDVTFNPEGKLEWAKSHVTEVTVRDDNTKMPETGLAGVNASSLKYKWVKGDGIPEENSFIKSFTNPQAIARALGTGDDWHLWILAKDNVGNTNIVTTNPFWLDNTKPLIENMVAKPSSENTYTLTMSGISDTDVVQKQSDIKGYYISTTQTPPTESSSWVPMTDSTVTSTIDETTNMHTYTVNYEATELTTYYFWVIDNAGNISEVKTLGTKRIFYSINDTSWYETFAEAVADVKQTGDTIKVLKNLTDVSDGTVGNNKTIKLDTNGKTLTRNEPITVKLGASLEIIGTGSITSAKATIVAEAGTIKVSGGTVEGDIYAGNGTVNLSGGTINGNVHGGKISGTAENSNIILDGATINGSIYGGGNEAQKVNEVNITLKSGNVNDVYGGGILNSAVLAANIVLDGAIITSGNIYGGPNTTGTVENSNVDIKSGTITNVYGGGTQGGTTLNTTVTIEAGAQVTGNVYGGAHKAIVGDATNNSGSTTVNIVGGTIEGSVYGGSDTNLVNGETNINIGKNAVGESSLTSGEITIKGNIYGGGHKDKDTVVEETEGENPDSGEEEIPDFTEVSVKNGTHISIDGNGAQINFGGHIFGSGERVKSEGTSSITIKNMGSNGNPYLINSIQRTGTLTIENSHLEIIGISDSSNLNVDASYTLNRIDSLNVKGGSYLYLRRGFNVVGELNSLSADGSKAQVTISEGRVTAKNADNRIYVYEGVNLFIAKEEYSKAVPIYEYGKVNGMTFFGMYTHDRENGNLKYDIYDPRTPTSSKTFILSSYIEGKYDATQAITVDGFYTNALENEGAESSTIIAKYVEVIPEAPTYQDWILDEKVYTEEVTLIAKRNKERVYKSIPLQYLNQLGAEYEVKLFSVNSFEPDIKLVSRTQIPRVASNPETANTNFALTMENGSGWQNKGETQFYTSGAPIRGTTTYISDYSGSVPYIDFYLYNSINITQTKDCGFVNLVFLVTKTTNGDASEGTKFKIAVSINIQTIGEIIEEKFQTDSRITEGKNFGLFSESEIFITDRSSMTTCFNMYPLGLYDNTEYRVLSSTCQLPLNTQITMVDYGEDKNNPKVYYYEIKNLVEQEAQTGRYIYNFSDFILMSSLTKEQGATDAQEEAAHFKNNNAAYSASGFEEYKILLDFKNATITEDLLKQNIRFELRDSSNVMKNYEILPAQFNIYTNKRSNLSLLVEKDTANVYDIIKNGNLTFTVESIRLTQSIQFFAQVNGIWQLITAPIEDTYFDEKKLGMAISLYDAEGNKVPYEKVKGIYYIVDGKKYYPDLTGTARLYLADNVVTVEKTVKMFIEGSSLESGTYSVRIENFASDNGTYFGNTGENQNNTEIKIINLSYGLKAEITDEDRLIDAKTGKTFEGSPQMDIDITASHVVKNTNIRVSMYKRDITYNDDLSYANVSYTLVDLANYVSNTLQKPEDISLTSSNIHEYIVTNEVKEETLIDLILNLNPNLLTGGYKLEFSIYSGDNLLGTIDRHFVVTDFVTVE